MAKYYLGNELRGFTSDNFESDEEAWEVLSERFNNAFPSKSGREVVLRKDIRIGYTEGGNERESDRILREELEKRIERIKPFI